MDQGAIDAPHKATDFPFQSHSDHHPLEFCGIPVYLVIYLWKTAFANHNIVILCILDTVHA